MKNVLPTPADSLAKRQSDLRFFACRVDIDGDQPRLDLLFASLSRSPTELQLRLAVTVDSQTPGLPQPVRPDLFGGAESSCLDGRTIQIAAGANSHLHTRVAGGDTVVVLADVMNESPARVAFAGLIEDRKNAPTGPRSRRFRPSFRFSKRACADQEPDPAELRREHFTDWETEAWQAVRVCQLTALYQESWLRAYKSRHNGHAEADLFEYVHAAVLMLRPQWCGTHEFGEEPGFSVVVASAVFDAIDTFRADASGS